MRHLGAAMRLDVTMQARSQLWAFGLSVAVAMGLMVRFLVPAEHAGRGLAAFYLVGLGGTTLLFGASLLLLEKTERTLQALRVSMITRGEYVASKALTLTAFAAAESAVVYAIAARGTPTNFALLALGIFVLGCFYALVGLSLAAPHEAVTSFLFPWGAFWGMVLQLPFATLLDLGPPALWYAIPTQAPLLLMQAAFEPLSAAQWAYALGMSAAMLAVGWQLCRLRFAAHVRLPEA